MRDSSLFRAASNKSELVRRRCIGCRECLRLFGHHNIGSKRSNHTGNAWQHTRMGMPEHVLSIIVIGKFACHHAPALSGYDSGEAGAVVQRGEIHYERNALGYASETFGNAAER